MDAALAQAALTDVEQVTLVTRSFAEENLPSNHAMAREIVADRVTIDRIATDSPRYLEKEALAAELPAFCSAFCRYLDMLPVLPDVIHAHFADAVVAAIEARRRFGIHLSIRRTRWPSTSVGKGWETRVSTRGSRPSDGRSRKQTP